MKRIELMRALENALIGEMQNLQIMVSDINKTDEVIKQIPDSMFKPGGNIISSFELSKILTQQRERNEVDRLVKNVLKDLDAEGIRND